MNGDVKACCATLYESDFARLLLGDSFHPGGLRLTERLGAKLGLGAGREVLDVASGKGESAMFLAQRFGCEVVGVDFGPENVRQAHARAEAPASSIWSASNKAMRRCSISPMQASTRSSANARFALFPTSARRLPSLRGC